MHGRDWMANVRKSISIRFLLQFVPESRDWKFVIPYIWEVWFLSYSCQRLLDLHDNYVVPRVFPDAEIEKACSALVQKLKQFREFELDMMAQNEANVLQPMLQARQRLSTGHEVDAGEGGKYTTNRSRNGRQHFIKFAFTLLRQGDIVVYICGPTMGKWIFLC